MSTAAITSRREGYDPSFYDAIPAGYYDKVFAQGRGVQWFWHRYRFAAVAEELPRSGRRLLDLGCGPGTFLGNFTAGYTRCVGIDVAEPQVTYARATYGNDRLTFQCADLAQFAGSEDFDAVVSLEVIEHLPPSETQQFLRSIRRLLRPGGTVVLTTPNYRSLWPVVEWLVSRRGPVDHLRQHINHFDRRRLIREFEHAGFVVKSCRTFFVVAPFLAAVSSRLAEAAHRTEQRLLSGGGCEVIVAAERPR